MSNDQTQETPDADHLLKATAKNVSDLASLATHQIGERVHRGKARLKEMQAILSDRTAEYTRSTEQYVRTNPWQAAGWAALAGLLLGLILRRR